MEYLTRVIILHDLTSPSFRIQERHKFAVTNVHGWPLWRSSRKLEKHKSVCLEECGGRI